METTNTFENIIQQVNTQFYTTVENWEKELNAHIIATEFTHHTMPNESQRPFNALRSAVNSLTNMLYDHDIEDLNYAHHFNPEFDWCNIRFNDFGDDEFNIWKDEVEYLKDLHWLNDNGVISGLTILGADSDNVVARFNIVGFKSQQFYMFEYYYKNLRDALTYFDLV